MNAWGQKVVQAGQAVKIDAESLLPPWIAKHVANGACLAGATAKYALFVKAAQAY
jgi:hypothetical protein